MSNVRYYINLSQGTHDLRKKESFPGEEFKDTLIETFFAFDDAERERKRLQWICDRNAQDAKVLSALKEYDNSEKSEVDVRGFILQMRMLFTNSGAQ